MNTPKGTITVIADDRERQSDVIAALSAIEGVTVTVDRLPLGDYRVDNALLFERKTLRDFAVSLIDGRLFQQMIRLAGSPLKGILVLEGTGRDLSQAGVRREALQGALITTTLVLGIAVLRSQAPEETARLMLYAARQMRSASRGGFLRPGYRPRSKRKRQLFILQGLPGVGRERAGRLLDAFGSVQGVVTAGPEALQSVPGIGPNIADRIKWAVGEQVALFGNEDSFSL